MKVKVGMIGAFDMLKFKNLAKKRDNYIQTSPALDINCDYAINNNAKSLHPDYMRLKIEEIIDTGTASTKIFVFSRVDRDRFPFFRAGQYISLKLRIGDSFVTRPYSICSSPKSALEGRLEIAVKLYPGGFVSEWMHNNLQVGDEIVSSAPIGRFYYEGMRDRSNVLGIAGGGGITPFLSMARAIEEGTEDFKLTIIYGSRKEENILYKEEFNRIQASTDKVKVIHVLSDEEKEGYENGLITTEIIRKYAEGQFSIFICGPEEMCGFVENEIERLHIPRRLIRSEILGVTKNVASFRDYPSENINKTFSIKVIIGPKKYEIEAKASEPILVALERAGIVVPSRCRNGECGWCRSRLVDGEFYIPEENDFRRYADIQVGYIHPCSTFPLSNMVIEVPGEYLPK